MENWLHTLMFSGTSTTELLWSLVLWRVLASFFLISLGVWVAFRLARAGMLNWVATQGCFLLILLGGAYLMPAWWPPTSEPRTALIICQATAIIGGLLLGIWAFYGRDINALLDYFHGCLEHRSEFEARILKHETLYGEDDQ